MNMVIQQYPLWFTLILLLVGLYGMLFKNNLLKQLISLGIFQTAVILFFIVMGHDWNVSVPILDKSLGMSADAYINPIPHGLMLTAIVVSVAMMGVGLALLIRIRRDLGSINEEELNAD